MSPKDQKKGAPSGAAPPKPPPPAKHAPRPPAAPSTAEPATGTAAESAGGKPAVTMVSRPDVERTVTGLLLLLLGHACVITPVFVDGWRLFDARLTVPAGLLIGALSFHMVSGAMLSVASSRHQEENRSRYGLSSLFMSLAMFYVVSFAILLTALLFGIGELATSGAELRSMMSGETVQTSEQRSLALFQSLLFSTSLALVGASFYIANRMRQRGTALDPEPFDALAFWGGLWFRLGQANLYTFAFFIYIWATSDAGQPAQATSASETSGDLAFGFRALPLIGLVLGMFVRTGEALVLGLAERLFEVAERVVGTQRRERSDGDAA